MAGGDESGGNGSHVGHSLRFNSADSAYLNRTPGSAGNRRTWTLSFWFKRSLLSTNIGIFMPVTGGDGFNECQMRFDSNDRLQVYDSGGSAGYLNVVTTRVFRDCSAWYHLVFVYDSTQATSSNRFKIYVNGVQETNLSTAQYPNQNNNSGWNGTSRHDIGRIAYASNQYFGGYLSECYMVDGTALTPSSFGETDTITGAWIPKKYSGSYGTNGFYLKFESSGIGTDSSGNGNTWTANNFSTSGTGTDVMSDTPTTNWCTLNPLKLGANVTLGDGNLVATMTSTNVRWNGTIAMSPGSGKYYAEMTVTQSNGYGSIGLSSIDDPATGELLKAYRGVSGTYDSTAYGNSYTTGDIIGIAYDAINGALYFSKNGTFQNSGDPTSGATATGAAETGLTGTYVVGGGIYGGSTGIYTLNFGQRAFAYTPPTGFKALNTANLPEPTIKKGSSYFDTKLYSGTSASQSITGLGFAPDFVWIKSKNEGYAHYFFDAVRTAGKYLTSNNTNTETTDSTTLSSFDSAGFSLGSASGTNNSGGSYVAWAWDANGAGSSNTAGTITSTVSANATAGFSIVSYTGTGSAATVGHGLGVAPSLIIEKNRDRDQNWAVYHSALGATKALILDDTFGAQTATYYWNDTAPTSTVFSIGTWNGVNSNGEKHVAYCFSEVAGYSKFGSYVGNGSSDGPFVYCGFRPAWILVKASSTSGYSWICLDAQRDPYNVSNNALRQNLSDAELTNTLSDTDLLSNGFKLKTNWADMNSSGVSYIFAAFAELPQKYSNAR